MSLDISEMQIKTTIRYNTCNQYIYIYIYICLKFLNWHTKCCGKCRTNGYVLGRILRQSPLIFPTLGKQTSFPSYSNNNLGTGSKGFCTCNLDSTPVDLRITLLGWTCSNLKSFFRRKRGSKRFKPWEFKTRECTTCH